APSRARCSYVRVSTSRAPAACSLAACAGVTRWRRRRALSRTWSMVGMRSGPEYVADKIGQSPAHVAQAVEHFLGKEKVPGSNPGVGSIRSSKSIALCDAIGLGMAESV